MMTDKEKKIRDLIAKLDRIETIIKMKSEFDVSLAIEEKLLTTEANLILENMTQEEIDNLHAKLIKYMFLQRGFNDDDE